MSAHADIQQDQSVISAEDIFSVHEGGKLSVEPLLPLDSTRALSLAYTPGVAQVSRAIAADPALAASHTWASRLVVVVSNGTAVLGLGDIGPAASLPVMEGKAALFKTFGGLNSIPLVLNTTNVDEMIETLVRLRPSYGAVNLEDISAPRCFDPGVFRGALDSGARRITLAMKVAAATAIADLVGENLSPDYIVPSPLDPRVAAAVAAAVASDSATAIDAS